MIYSARSVGNIRHIEVWFPVITINWPVIGRIGFPAPLDDLFENVSDADELTRVRASEFFTWSEVSLFKGWLAVNGGPKLETQRINLPISGSLIPLGEVPQIASFQGTIYFDEAPDWNLPFSVYGVYDIRTFDSQTNNYTVPSPLHPDQVEDDE